MTEQHEPPLKSRKDKQFLFNMGHSSCYRKDKQFLFNVWHSSCYRKDKQFLFNVGHSSCYREDKQFLFNVWHPSCYSSYRIFIHINNVLFLVHYCECINTMRCLYFINCDSGHVHHWKNGKQNCNVHVRP